MKNFSNILVYNPSHLLCDENGSLIGFTRGLNDYVFDINEHLRSVDPKIVVKLLNKEFADGPVHFKFVEQYGGVHNAVCRIRAHKDLKKLFKKIDEFLELMHWKIYHNPKRNIYDPKYWYFEIIAEHTEEVTDYVYNDCKGIIYHWASSKMLPYILKNGLRDKPGGRSVDRRSYPARIYFIAAPPQDVKTSCMEIRKTLNTQTCDVLLQIDVSKFKMTFWKDSMYSGPHAVYAYTHIPPEFIKVITLNEL